MKKVLLALAIIGTLTVTSCKQVNTEESTTVDTTTPADAKVSDVTYNGAQIASALEIVAAVGLGTLTQEQAIVFLVQFLGLDVDVAKSMFQTGGDAVAKLSAQKKKVVAKKAKDAGITSDILENQINLTKIAKVKSVNHKNIDGNVKTCTVKKEADKWYVIFAYEIEYNETTSETNEAIGIDVGLSNFVVFSDETVIPNPRFFKEEEKKIAKLQSRRDKTKNKKLNKAIQKRHNKIKNKRKDFCHKLSRKIVNKYSKIFVEDLNINSMKEDMKYLSKSINDASWNLFINNLIYKAEDAGRLIKLINPAYTSQDCSNCSYRVKKKLSDRTHNCPNCGLKIDRDLNAAKNILRIGLYSLGENP